MESQNFSPEIKNICKPFLEKFDLNAFSYSRVFNDGSRSELWTDAAALEHTFHKARYIVGAYTPQYFKSDERYSFLKYKIETYPEGLKKRYKNQLIDQREYFNHDHCFLIIKHNEEFCEYFIFYAPVCNEMATNHYVNNIDELEAFCKYFVHSAEKIITVSDQHRILTTEIFTARKFQDQKAIAKKMTPREHQVARLLITGATIKDVAIELKISPRTVESHVERLKIEYGCTRKSMLIKELYLCRHSLN
ncbi:helix-turn-helix transcriptional regulator [Acidovorax sp. CCYZU-2555]|uniref:helix-turn-helix transcriptional regulator n=1 Tax=Acidovorax sp. CCYZU-2555 TaxID=2835042 RepID=UPI001BD095B7|nr:helix-turn-helix transcriptional regulator [Acidovorax sp. CCYZU-2555]MBS7776848.1 LuxR family transcriptional regulator [Acidovorax sp. CCYZU-2555]